MRVCILARLLWAASAISLQSSHQKQGKELREAVPAQHERIAILTSCHGMSADRVKHDSFEDNILNKACYSHLHGYELIIDSNDYVANRTVPKQNTFGTTSGEREAMHSFWNKPFSIKEHLPNYDWILWMDGDLWFNAMTKPLSQYLAEFRLHGSDVHLFLPTDSGGPAAKPKQNWLSGASDWLTKKSKRNLLALDREADGLVVPAESGGYEFSAYAFFIRNSEVGRSLVDTWLNLGMGTVPAPCEHRWWNPSFYDQGWLYIAIVDTFAKYRKSPSKCFSDCEATNSADWHKGPVKCLNDEMNAASYPRSSVGKLLDKVKGPFAFSNFETSDLGQPDTGLAWNFECCPVPGQNKSWPTDTARVQSALTWHMKPWRPHAAQFVERLENTKQWCTKSLGCYAEWDYVAQKPAKFGCTK